MAYDEGTAEHIRQVLTTVRLEPGEELSESKMFGGICFSLNKKMLVGIAKENLVVRLHDEDLKAALEDGSATPMDFTGKPLRNFAYLPAKSWQSDDAMRAWIEKSAKFVREKMLAKPTKPRKAKS